MFSRWNYAEESFWWYEWEFVKQDGQSVPLRSSDIRPFRSQYSLSLAANSILEKREMGRLESGLKYLLVERSKAKSSVGEIRLIKVSYRYKPGKMEPWGREPLVGVGL